MTQPTDAVDGRAFLDDHLLETEFQHQVTEMAEKLGWMWHHETDSRKTEKGWPDLILCRPPRVVVIELKRQPKRYKVTPEQALWVTMLDGCTEVRAFVARPADWDEIQEVLR